MTRRRYAARSRASWGIGDLRDLDALRTAAQRHAPGFVLVNAMYAAAPVDAQENCPYLAGDAVLPQPLYLI